MPNFPGTPGGTTFVASNASPIAIAKPGDYVYVFGLLAASATQLPVNDTNVAFEAAPGAPQASIAVELPCAENAPPPMVCVEVLTNGAPGAGESIAIQEADTHADGFFITPTNPAYTIATFNSNNAARADISPTGGKFLRVQRTAGANAVGAKVKITRLA
jgi:hypothetical protein